MGILTDIVVAKTSEAVEVLDSENPWEDFDGFDAKGLDEIKLCSLWQIVGNRPNDDGLITQFSVLAGIENECGPWVWQIPDELVELISAIRADALEAVALQWSRTEEFKMDRLPRWELEEVKNLLRNLVGVSNKAISSGKALLMWICL